MKRWHLFEFCDLPATPDWLRGYVLDILQFQSFALYRCLAPELARWLRQQGITEIHDIASGSGGPWPRLVRQLAAAGMEVHVTLSDRYPSPRPVSDPRIRYAPEAVDLTFPFEGRNGARSFFTCLHHLRPDQVSQLFAAAARTDNPILIAEFTRRSWRSVAAMMFSPLVVAIQTPFLRPLGIGRLFWTYVVPAVPIIYMWDGAVSHLRSYRTDELKAMIADLPPAAYRWEVGECEDPHTRGIVTYVLGFAPKAKQPTAQ